MVTQHVLSRDHVKERIADILARNEMIRAENEFEISDKVKWLEKTFSGIKINVVNHTYTDFNKAPPVTRKINDLQSPRANKSLKTMNADARKEVDGVVSTIINKRRDSIKHLGDEYIEMVTKWMFDAIVDRNELIVAAIDNGNTQEYDVMDSICGMFPIEGTPYYFRISVDPFDVFMKSTGQYWEHESCEKISGLYKRGPFDDIKLYNAVCFIEDGTGRAHARIMIRECEWGKNVDVGIESKWYAYVDDYISIVNLKDKDDFKELVTPSITGFKAYEMLHDLLRSKGLLKYGKKSCTTPYSYEGFSDKERAGHVAISYEDYSNVLENRYKTTAEMIIKSDDDEKIFQALQDHHDSGYVLFSFSETIDLFKALDGFTYSIRALKMLSSVLPKTVVVDALIGYDERFSEMKPETDDVPDVIDITGVNIFATLMHDEILRDLFLKYTGRKIATPLRAIAYIVANGTSNYYSSLQSGIALAASQGKFLWENKGSKVKLLRYVAYALNHDVNSIEFNFLSHYIGIGLLMHSLEMVNEIFTDKNAYNLYALDLHVIVTTALVLITHYKVSRAQGLGIVYTHLPKIIEDLFNFFIGIDAWASVLLLIIEFTADKPHGMEELAIKMAKQMESSYERRDLVLDTITKLPESPRCQNCGRYLVMPSFRSFSLQRKDRSVTHRFSLCTSCADVLGIIYDRKFTFRVDLVTNVSPNSYAPYVNKLYAIETSVSAKVIKILRDIDRQFSLVY